MSVNGLQQTYIPSTLDGLTIVDADQIYIDGNLVNLDDLVPYVNASRTIDLNSQIIRTTYTASQPADLVNKALLDADLSQLSVLIEQEFLSKNTLSPQSVAGPVDFSSIVNINSNYLETTLTSASVTVGQYFGTITNSLGVYQSTCTNNSPPILILFPITAGHRYTLSIETLIEDSSYDWTLDIYQSADNVTPYPNFNQAVLDSHIFAPASTVFHLTSVSFNATTTGTVVLTISSSNPSGVGTVKWKNMAVYNKGVALTNASMPSQTADRVLVLNTNKQVVASGINTTKLGYLDNVSSDIQTQLNSKASTTYVDTQDGLRVLKAGDTMTGTLIMGANKITSSYTPIDADDLTRKGYVDSAISAIGTNYLPLTGGTLSGALTISSGALTVSNRLLGVPDTATGGNFWIGLTGSNSEIDRLALSIIGNQTTGTATGVSIAKPLYINSTVATAINQTVGLTDNFAEALKVVQTTLSYNAGSFQTTNLPPLVQGGTISGSYRLTATASQSQMAMSLNGFTYTTGEVYTFSFTGVQASTALTLQVLQATQLGVISINPITNNITTSAGQTITGSFIIANTGGNLAFVFQAGVLNPYVDWTGFTLYRGDSYINTVTTNRVVIYGDNLPYANRGSNPVGGQLVVADSSSSERLYLGASYTSGVGSCCIIQASDYYSASDHAQPIIINPIGGNIGIYQNSPQWLLHVSRTNAWATLPSYTKADGIMALGGKDNDPDYQYLIFPNPSQYDSSLADMYWWSSDMITGRYKNEYRLAWWKETHGGALGNAYKEGISLYLTDSDGYTNLDYIKLNGKTVINGQVSTYSSTADYTNTFLIQSPWAGITLDNTQLASGRKWALFSGGTGAGIGVGNFGIFDITANAYRFCIKSTGFVGIGAEDPYTKLEVKGAGTLIGAFNPDGGDNYTAMRLMNNTFGGCYWFMNSSERTADGGVNTATLRNDVGTLRLQAQYERGFRIDNDGCIPTNCGTISSNNPGDTALQGYFGITRNGARNGAGLWTGVDSGNNVWQHSLAPSISWNGFFSRAASFNWFVSNGPTYGSFFITNNGAVNVAGNSPVAVQSGFMARGSLTVGSTDANYGWGTNWNSNTAGIMLECADLTEIAVHDSGERVASLIAYAGGAGRNTVLLGRDMGWGAGQVETFSTLSVAGSSGFARLNVYNPNGSYTHFGSSDYGNCNYIRGRTIINSGYFEIGDSYVWRAPLDITTTVGRDNGAVRYFDVYGGLGYTNWYSYSAMADTWGGSRFMAYSDVRKKKNIQPVVNALQVIDDIRIVSYEHIDVAQPPNYWGVIAQEVESKYPHLITTGKEFLPNIYKDAVSHHCTDCGCFVWLEMEEEQSPTMVGKAIRIYTYDEDEKKEYEEHTDVVKVDGKRIKVKKWVKGQEERYVATERVFVYGTCEDDVRTVDKTQFGLLAVSACQELKHQTETQKGMIEALSSRIGVLEAREVMWEQHAKDQDAKIEKLASLVAQLIK